MRTNTQQSTVRSLCLSAAFGIAVIGASSCSSADRDGAGPEGPGEPNPFVERMLAREVELPERRKYVSADGKLEFDAPAEPVGSIERDAENEQYRFSLSIGDPSNISCILWEEPLDLASAMQWYSRTFLKVIRENDSPIEIVDIHGIDARVVDGLPALGIEWLLALEGENGSVLEHVKVHGAVRRTTSLICAHVGPGYARNVTDVFDSILGTYTHPAEPLSRPAFEEIYILSAAAMNLGYLRVATTEITDETIEYFIDSPTLIPNGHDIVAADLFESPLETRSGANVDRLIAKALDGNRHTSLDLSRDAAGQWIVTGTYESEDFDAVFEPTSFLGFMGQRRAIADALVDDGANARVSFMDWIPEVDPARPTRVDLTVIGERHDGTFDARLSAGSSTYPAVVGADGALLRVVKAVEDLEAVLTRVYSNGELP